MRPANTPRRAFLDVGGPSGVPEIDLAETVRDALSTAGLSPSSHNSQPWALAFVESRPARLALAARLGSEPGPALILALDERRKISALPDHAIEMLTSSGMFLHALVAVLADLGVGVEIAWAGDGGLEVEGVPNEWRTLAALRLTRAPPAGEGVARVLEARVTNRGAYRSDPVGPGASSQLSEARSAFSIVGASRAHVTQIDPSRLKTVGDFVSRHGAVDFSHKEAWAETYRYIRFSPEATARAVDGFSIEQLFGPLPAPARRFLQIGLSPVAMRLFGATPVPRVLAKGLGDLIRKGTPSMVAFSTDDAAPRAADLLLAGGEIMAYWLLATRLGLALHPVSVILQHPEVRRRFQQELGLAGRVLFLARLGAPSVTFPRTPRRNLTMDGYLKV